MLPKAVVYRTYGEALAVVMNVKSRRVALLRGQTLRAWRELLAAGRADGSEQTRALAARLMELGVLGERAAGPAADGPAASLPTPEVDIGLVNLWAFKNHIPISGHFELTGRCNLRCRHCYGLFDTRQDTLDTGQVFRILDDLRASGTLGLVLTGGELFFRPDILDILKYLAELKFVVRINSNGTLIDEALVREMQALENIYRIHISLYSATPEVHDRITHAPGSYVRTVRALHLLKEAGFDVRINCSVMKSNFDTFQAIQTEVGDPLGLPVHYDAEIFPKDDGGTENLAERLDAQQLQAFMRLNVIQKAGPPKQKLCKAGFAFFSICEDGRLLPCLKMKRYYQQPLGNLTTRSFSEIWQSSPIVLQIRAAIESQLSACDLCDLSI